jgi:hypothetical protein
MAETTVKPRNANDVATDVFLLLFAVGFALLIGGLIARHGPTKAKFVESGCAVLGLALGIPLGNTLRRVAVSGQPPDVNAKQ